MTWCRTILIVSLVLGLGLSTADAQIYGVSLDRADEVAAASSFQDALEHNRSGTATRWRNPDNNTSGLTEPVRTFQTTSGVYCREFQQTIIIADRQERGYGTACRQPDGSWQIVNPANLRQLSQQPRQVTRVKVYEPRYRPAYYPVRFYPSYLSFSFGYVKHRGHHYRGHGHNRHYGHRGHAGKHHRSWGFGHRGRHR